jgi:hypothetical protein
VDGHLRRAAHSLASDCKSIVIGLTHHHTASRAGFPPQTRWVDLEWKRDFSAAVNAVLDTMPEGEWILRLDPGEFRLKTPALNEIEASHNVPKREFASHYIVISETEDDIIGAQVRSWIHRRHLRYRHPLWEQLEDTRTQRRICRMDAPFLPHGDVLVSHTTGQNPFGQQLRNEIWESRPAFARYQIEREMQGLQDPEEFPPFLARVMAGSPGPRVAELFEMGSLGEELIAQYLLNLPEGAVTTSRTLEIIRHALTRWPQSLMLVVGALAVARRMKDADSRVSDFVRSDLLRVNRHRRRIFVPYGDVEAITSVLLATPQAPSGLNVTPEDGGLWSMIVAATGSLDRLADDDRTRLRTAALAQAQEPLP